MPHTSDTSAESVLDAPARPELHRLCTECGKPLRGKRGKRPHASAKTCSTKCRGARRRRLDRLARARELAERGIDPVTDGVGTEALQKAMNYQSGSPREKPDDVVAEVLKDELRPVVREQITEETLSAIQMLVKATPTMVQAIVSDIQHPDPVIRQRAYSVMARYTLGHTAIVTPPEQAARQQMTVVFPGMVRPGHEPAPAAEDVVDMTPRICNSCDTEKPGDQFVEESDLCLGCFEERRARMTQVMGGDDALA